MNLKELIEQYKECSDCMKSSNYPKDWLEDIIARKKEVFASHTSKEERLSLVNAIHEEYSTRFDNENLEIKIPYEGMFYTLEEAEALLATEEHSVMPGKSISIEEYKQNRQAVTEAKKYLADTDYKLLSDYDKDISEVLALRAEARKIIRKIGGV